MNIPGEIMEFHMKNTVIDAHADTFCKILEKRKFSPEEASCHVDLKGLLNGGVNLQVFALYTPPSYQPIPFTLEMIDLFYKWKDANQELIHILKSGEDFNKIKENKILCLLSIEGGEALEEKLFMIDIYYRLGVRAMGLTWNGRNAIADGVRVSRNPGGLTFFGEEVVKKMNKIGMIIDVSHMAEKGFWDVIHISDKPVIASHSNCLALHNNPRNLSDKQIIGIAKKNGVIGITYVKEFLGNGEVSAEIVVDHIEYIINITGSYDYVGLGSDFDGTEKLPQGLEHVSKLPVITDILIKRKHSQENIKKILGYNWLRVFNEIII